jgi:hypothetical protein
MKTRQAWYVQMASHATSAEVISAADQLHISANLLSVANAMLDYDQAKHAYDLARRSYEDAARNLMVDNETGERAALTEKLRDLGVRLREFEWDLGYHSNWSERFSVENAAAALRTGAIRTFSRLLASDGARSRCRALVRA